MEGSIYKRIINEAQQAHELRVPLIQEIRKHFENRNVVSFYTSFHSNNGAISDNDCEMLRDILHSLPKDQRKLLLIINSPGGDPLAAERFIKICREVSDHDYWVLVPGQAKSAATMISLGASQVYMTDTSELGPIDIQVPWGDELVPAHIIVSSYEELMQKGIHLPEDQRIEPILQQLQSFNAPQIENWKMARDLAEDIAEKVLREGMLAQAEKEEFQELMKKFIAPKELKNHARPIFYSDFKSFDTQGRFQVNCLFNTDDRYAIIHEYHMRLMFSMHSGNIAKVLETEEDMFTVAS